MRFLKIILVSLLLISVESFAHEGGWSGGGGEVIGDIHNPWFTQSKKVVFYCVKQDLGSFSATPKSFDEALEHAIHQWSGVFKRYQQSHPGNALRLATQTWVRMDCSQKVDVKFLLGFNTLSPEEHQFLARDGNPHRYIGYAVRTHYDSKLLSSEGFVFLGSDLGSNSFTRRAGQIDQPWSYPGILFGELTHELGHIYGLKHSGSAFFSPYPRAIMAEDYPEILVAVPNDPDLKMQLQKICEMKDYFSPTEYVSCDLMASQKRLLNIPDETYCVNFNVEKETEIPNSVLIVAKNKNGITIAQNTIRIRNLVNWRFSQDISLFLTSKQEVFSETTKDEHSISGPGPDFGECAGYMEPTFPPANLRKVLISFGEDSLKVFAIDSQSLDLFPIANAQPKFGCPTER